MWTAMNAFGTDVLANSTDEGIRRVRQGRRRGESDSFFAFIMENVRSPHVPLQCR